ncbi:MAG: insulinase family protein [Candidatus Hydrogenedentes bacterium]|nr:insulinase family protein [Candidatus Hydrogenedentota bacterium]
MAATAIHAAVTIGRVAVAADAGNPMPAQTSPTDIRVSTLDNGIVTVLEQMPWVHSASLGVWIRAGSACETAETNGVSHLLEHLFFKGTPTRNVREIVETVEKSGGSANAFTGREHTCLYVKMLDTHLFEGLDLLSDILLNSLFCDFEKEKQIVLEEISSVNDNPEELLHDLFMADLWPDHPLGFPIAGARDVVAEIDVDQVRNYHKRQYIAENIVVAAAGNFDCDELLRRIEIAFKNVGNGQVCRNPSMPRPAQGVRRHDREIEQTHISLGAEGISAADDQRYTLAVLSAVLGGTAMSRLFQRVRENEGLAYSVYSFTSALERTGVVGIAAAVAPKNLDRTVEIVLDEIDRMRTEPVSADELSNAREYLKGSIILGLESTFNRMSRIARSHMYRGEIESIETVLERIDSVNAEDILQLANHVFGPGKEILTTLGPPREPIASHILERINPTATV